LSAIKIQNGLVFSFLYIGVFIFQADKNMKALSLYCFVALIAMVVMGDTLLATLNYFKLAFLSEDNAIANLNSYTPYKSVIELIIISPLSFIEGMARPLPQNLTTSIFLLESLVQIAIILFLFKRGLKEYLYTPQFIIVLITFVMGIVLNNLVIENDFTYIRYKYTFVSMFIIYLLIYKTLSQKKPV
jgi:hypothetical protein